MMQRTNIMHQVLIIETSVAAYSNLLNQYLKSGYKLVVGSNYIKSLPTNISVVTNQVLDDIEHAFSIALCNELETIIFSKDLTSFREATNKQLATNKLVVGSLYIEQILKDSYEKCKRIYTTYYSCCVYKE